MERLSLGGMDSNTAHRLNRGHRQRHMWEGSRVTKTILVGSVLAATLLFASQPVKAEWLCGVDQCVWVTYDVDEPAYALAWGPPIMPSCYWKQGVFGRWKMICPRRY